MRSLLILTLLLSPILLHSQNIAEKKLQARQFFSYGKFEEAHSILSNERKLRLQDREAQFLIALCNFHLNQLDASEEQLQKLVSDKKDIIPEAFLYLGKVYHARHEFDKAVEYYKVYLKLIPNKDTNRAMVRDAIRRCANGLQLRFRQPLAFSEPLGDEINTEHDEFGPVLSPTRGDRLYFSTARPGNLGGPRDQAGLPNEPFGHHRTDIFYSDQRNGQWTRVTNMHYLLNSPQNEVLLGFSENGKAMYYFRGNRLDEGQIFLDTFRLGQRTLTSDPFLGPVDALAGNSSPYFAGDSIVIFPSRRPGGYGGLDLYKARKVNGRWTDPENLGPVVNGPYDETTPFLALDGQSLYFSTNDPERSIGGFDIFKTVYNPSLRRWTNPFNLGLPVNSAGDDTHFRLSRDGYTAYLTSNRKDGLGKRDIFAAYFFDYLTEMQPRR